MVRRSSEEALNAPFRKEKAKRETFVGCDKPGCRNKGEHRAPKRGAAGRGLDGNRFYLFCLEHVQEYNRSWNYFEGMSPVEMEAQRRADILWQRPTYKMGSKDRKGQNPYSKGEPRFQDNFGFWNQRFGHEQDADKGPFSSGVTMQLTPQQRKALATLGLDAPISAEEVKARYKKLAKELHPDLNPDNEHAEDMLKEVNQAYTLLKDGIQEPAFV